MVSRIIIPQLDVPKARFSWTEVGYTFVPKILPGAGIVAIGGKACGTRSDDLAFFAVYDLPWVYPANFDWTVEAKSRLDTFLDCACSVLTGVCSYHQFTTEEWRKQDELRNHLQPHEIPAVLGGHLGQIRKPGGKLLEMPS